MARGKSKQEKHTDAIAAVVAKHSCNQYRWCMTCKLIVDDPAYHVATQIYVEVMQPGIRVDPPAARVI